MRLIELDPQWEHENHLVFNCPTCPRDPEKGRYGNCLIQIPVKPRENGWDSNGETAFEKLSIMPSIWHHCESDPHFFITEGEIKMA